LVPAEGALVDDLRRASVEVLVGPVAVLRRALLTPRGISSLPAAAVRDGYRVRKLIRHRGVALVHSNTSVVLSGAAAAASARVPHVWHVREIYARFGRAWPAYRQLLGTASALPCVSEATAAQFRPSDGARVIRDGLAVAPERAERHHARAALELDPHVPAIAVLGRISDWKGQDVLVRALAEPPLSELGAVGLIAGEVWPGAAERLDRVLDLARALGVADRVKLLGFRADVENVYGAADVVAVPSTQPDPLPNAALEAAAAGCAVIASAHGGLPEIIRDGQTGRLVAPGDAGALARAARELIDDPDEARRLGTAAAADAKQRYAPARMLDAIHALYDDVLRRD
jgi:glycosyltransferase involved in cell wall biosynthesis